MADNTIEYETFEASYEIIEESPTAIRVRVDVPGCDSCRINISAEGAAQHPDGVDAAVQQQVRDAAARRYRAEKACGECQSEGSVEVDPMTRNGDPEGRSLPERYGP